MKLATFTAMGDTRSQIGVVQKETVVSLSQIAPNLATDMTDLIAHWDCVQGTVHRLVASATEVLSLSEVHFLAPIARPSKILAIGMNFRDHIEEGKLPMPDRPIWFSKMPTCANGPFDPLPIPVVSNKVDYEAEMVAVIGRGGRYIKKADAPAAVFGFCCGNDASARDWQASTSQWVAGKSFDGHAPFGPWITTTDEVENPHALALRCFVNGVLHQSSNTDQLVFDTWDQVANISQVMTLEPGDLIFTGTPGAVGAGRRPRPFLKDGDSVRIEIETLGTIENVCRDEDASPWK